MCVQNLRVSDRKEVANEFKEVYRSKSKEKALSSLKEFINKWKHKQLKRNFKKKE